MLSIFVEEKRRNTATPLRAAHIVDFKQRKEIIMVLSDWHGLPLAVTTKHFGEVGSGFRLRVPVASAFGESD
ncbi:MAG: hypothetical protein U5N23_29145 [Acidovorax sp.]|nr:hypothetical protein [Acidovorax sp.]MDZ7866830.1 hypothetical protein [Acidovorax sp.]